LYRRIPLEFYEEVRPFTMRLFGKTKSPKEIISNLRENLVIIQATGETNQTPARSEKERTRAAAEVTRLLNSLKEQVSSAITAATTASSSAPLGGSLSSQRIANPDGGALAMGAGALPPSSLDAGAEGSSGPSVRANETLAEVGVELQSHDTLYLLLSCMDRIDFESTKYVVDLFCLLIHRQVGESRPMLNYLCKNPRVLILILCGYEKSEHAIQYGTMLREAARHEELARLIIYSQDFYRLFKYVQGTTFDVSSDAFQSLRDLLTRHKVMVSKFLESNYVKFFEHYHLMINSENYVTKRQALKLLSELLLERANFSIMRRYIDDVENLKLIMNLLKAPEKQIAFEAFHCFKVFVANPNKTRQISSILLLNREKLVEFLTNFLPDRSEDVQFSDEKAYLIKTIRELKLPVDEPTALHATQPTAPATSTNSASSPTSRR
jgi:calcium binding protein 39